MFGLNNYHNTVTEPAPVADSYEAIARLQNQKILGVFTANPHRDFTPCEVWKITGESMFLTSVRRALTTMTKQGQLVMTGRLRKSVISNRNVNTWKIKKDTAGS